MVGVENLVSRLGALLGLVTLGAIFAGIAQGLRRPKGRTLGVVETVPGGRFALGVGVGYSLFSLLLWRPLPWRLSPNLRPATALLGAALYVPGLALVLWSRWTLGKMYNVSSGFGVQLYADHRLVTGGPYGLVRHPIYLGILLAAVGGLLIYRTWAVLLMVVISAGLVLRAKNEERVLAAEFGEAWAAYCQVVPAWMPHLPA